MHLLHWLYALFIEKVCIGNIVTCCLTSVHLHFVFVGTNHVEVSYNTADSSGQLSALGNYVLVLQYQEYTFSPVLCSYLSTTLCLFYCTRARVLVYTLIQGICAYTGTCIGIIVYTLQVWYYCIITIIVY